MVLNFIKADKTADFEMVVTKLKEALAKSAKPERKQQAMSWKVFKAAEPGAGGSVLYVFIVDPSVRLIIPEHSNTLSETQNSAAIGPDERRSPTPPATEMTVKQRRQEGNDR